MRSKTSLKSLFALVALIAVLMALAGPAALAWDTDCHFWAEDDPFVSDKWLKLQSQDPSTRVWHDNLEICVSGFPATINIATSFRDFDFLYFEGSLTENYPDCLDFNQWNSPSGPGSPTLEDTSDPSLELEAHTARLTVPSRDSSR